MFIDTHTHIYLDEFESDLDKCIERSLSNSVGKLLMPNVDLTTLEALNNTYKKYKDVCFPMNGLHPCSVDENFEKALKQTKEYFEKLQYIAVGEIGIDFYWDTSFAEEQIQAFKTQIEWAKEFDLPFVIHSRSSLDLTIRIVSQSSCSPDACVFHCFDGNLEQARKIVDMGMKLGIGGVLTFKKSKIVEVVREIDLKHLVLETDSPYLTPSPHRGTRNESSYIPIIAKKMAEIKECTIEEVGHITSQNAIKLFGL